ncbi:Nitrate/nitrite transporter NarK [Pseudonocardia thermophila]|jgi:Nitrate/nitrite transporter|uniref:Nitrate/nitrite transporter NarK n=1 Tax=Pseudonocardia thermophila TaxID=1848 RepID=A0A1M6T7I8_PSETH|nr:MFS transporter [Pseudonocardia thermophila]SHK52874.1 Nitrate/nitrite transporter NarK [Pseudonocardia thermophila]
MGRAVVAVSFVAIGFGTAPAFLVSFLAPVLQDDLGLSRTAIGVLVGVMFGATGLGCILAGRVTEIIGARWSVGLDGVLLAGALLLPVLLPGYPALVTCVVLAGIGYGLVQVATNVAVVAALPPQHHGVGLAVKTAGVPGIVTVLSLVAPPVGAAVGWQPVFVTGAVAAALLGIAAVCVLPDARRSRNSGPRIPLPRRFWRYTLGATLLIAGSQPIYSWAVPYLHEATGASLALAGAVTGLASFLALAPMIAAARIADRLGAHRRLPIAVVLVGVLTAAEALIALLSTQVVAGAIGIVVATGAQLGAISLMHAAVAAAAPDTLARAAAMTMVGFYSGALISAPLFGMLVDASGSYAVGWAASTVLVAAAAATFWWCRPVGHRAENDAAVINEAS